ncbi:putative secreted protein with PEP-CTERM sorting signal [Pseudoduganella flava]|uniref:PEP-CTERM sorting domain-containing protein n=1 Tax=Pseudoduganella flava TaxID=871742 RepID=A0A562Q009_9BURK|nr:PEP-CTERM sorting domain-containing protein [Pseudoduganella flava]QGZ38443.1 PEP-CTERM sorting domain-containing protein [Pseudoduganella flava]TWI50009.1 putative secreted protein with PEP-CTERM sorting signal [Pseudoduganella flava]
MKTLLQRVAAVAAMLAFALNASAAIGSAGAADVTLAGQPADAFAYQDGWNPHAGPGGDTSGFGTAFDGLGAGPFTLLDRYDHTDGFSNTGMLTYTFTETTGTSGMWSVTNTSATQMVTLDLVFAIHAGNQGGAWLFDDQMIMPGATLTGDWRILWTVGQGNHPDFSNLTLFGRDIATTPVPEPQAPAMLLAGLALTALALRRGRRR